MANEIHATAVVSPAASLGDGNRIGPFAVIEDEVVLGNNNTLMTGVVLKNGTQLGNNNMLHEYAVVGGLPQDLGFKGGASYVRIGNDNVLRESIIIHRASKEQQATMLGDNNYLMNLAHVGHDCVLGNYIIMAPSAALGGFVKVEDRAFISGGVMVHQFVQIGAYAMIGGNSKITQDVLPYMITDGIPGQVRGLNIVGLKRAGFSRDNIKELKRAYKILLRSAAPLDEIVTTLRQAGNAGATHLADFVNESRRGFHREKTSKSAV